MRTITWEYRLVWRRQGDKADRSKIFATTRPLYMFLLRLGTQTPWKGMTKSTLRAASMILAKLSGLPMGGVLITPIREVALGITKAHRPLLWLRVEQRQVMKWTEVGDPLNTLRPLTYDTTEAMIETFCDDLDQHTAMRWLPREKQEIK